MAGKIFINYRRDDSIGMAGRLHDRLALTFGRDNLFMDLDHIPVGEDFEAHLNRHEGKRAAGFFEALARRQAAEVRHAHFGQDAPTLVARMPAPPRPTCPVAPLPVMIRSQPRDWGAHLPARRWHEIRAAAG